MLTQLFETLAKPGRGNVLVARAAANRGQRGRCPSHARGFASASLICHSFSLFLMATKREGSFALDTIWSA